MVSTSAFCFSFAGFVGASAGKLWPSDLDFYCAWSQFHQGSNGRAVEVLRRHALCRQNSGLESQARAFVSVLSFFPLFAAFAGFGFLVPFPFQFFIFLCPFYPFALRGARCELFLFFLAFSLPDPRRRPSGLLGITRKLIRGQSFAGGRHREADGMEDGG